VWDAYLSGRTNLGESVSVEAAARGGLRGIERFEPLLEELSTAALERPQMRFPVRYQDGFAALLPHLARMRSITEVLQLRAVARLRTGDVEGAFRDIGLGFRLRDGIAMEPLLISLLVRATMESTLYQPIWEGCQDHRWTEGQLKALQEMVGREPSIPALIRAMRGERVMADRLFEALVEAKKGGPKLEWFVDAGGTDAGFWSAMRLMNRGWLQQNRVVHGRFLQGGIDALEKHSRHDQLPSLDDGVLQMHGKRSVYGVVAATLAPAIDKAIGRAFEMESRRRLALTGLGLERHRLAHGAYPAELKGLAPAMVEAEWLTDPMDGAPMRYAARADGTYLLYSVGLDHRDDAGARMAREPRKMGGGGSPKGDLVW